MKIKLKNRFPQRALSVNTQFFASRSWAAEKVDQILGLKYHSQRSKIPNLNYKSDNFDQVSRDLQNQPIWVI